MRHQAGRHPRAPAGIDIPARGQVAGQGSQVRYGRVGCGCGHRHIYLPRPIGSPPAPTRDDSLSCRRPGWGRGGPHLAFLSIADARFPPQIFRRDRVGRSDGPKHCARLGFMSPQTRVCSVCWAPIYSHRVGRLFASRRWIRRLDTRKRNSWPTPALSHDTRESRRPP